MLLSASAACLVAREGTLLQLVQTVMMMSVLGRRLSLGLQVHSVPSGWRFDATDAGLRDPLIHCQEEGERVLAMQSQSDPRINLSPNMERQLVQSFLCCCCRRFASAAFLIRFPLIQRHFSRRRRRR